MEDMRHPKQVLQYRNIGRKSGKPLHRLLDGYSREAEIAYLSA